MRDSKRTTMRRRRCWKNIQYYSSGQFRITTIDATNFRILIIRHSLYIVRRNIKRPLRSEPCWYERDAFLATHAQGFSCNCAWESNGNRWGTIPVKRYIRSFAFNFTEGVRPSAASPADIDGIHIRSRRRSVHGAYLRRPFSLNCIRKVIIEFRKFVRPTRRR